MNVYVAVRSFWSNRVPILLNYIHNMITTFCVFFVVFAWSSNIIYLFRYYHFQRDYAHENVNMRFITNCPIIDVCATCAKRRTHTHWAHTWLNPILLSCNRVIFVSKRLFFIFSICYSLCWIFIFSIWGVILSRFVSWKIFVPFSASAFSRRGECLVAKNSNESIYDGKCSFVISLYDFMHVYMHALWKCLHCSFNPRKIHWFLRYMSHFYFIKISSFFLCDQTRMLSAGLLYVLAPF